MDLTTIQYEVRAGVSGVTPDGTSSYFLARHIGLRRMLDLTLTNRVTGHELDTIDQVLKYYAVVTADQAAAALNIRLAYEGQSA